MMSKLALTFLILASTAACVHASEPTGGVAEVSSAELRNPNPEDWLMFRRTLDSWGHSPLKQLDTKNVEQLKLVWKLVLPGGIQEGTPLVHDGMMYFPGPKDETYAIEAASGKVVWKYKRPYPAEVADHIPFSDINRSLAIYGDTVIDQGNDQFLYALKVSDGSVAWEKKINDWTSPSQQSTGPITADGKIFSTRGCEPNGTAAGCVVTAHDAKSGAELWRTSLIAKPGEPGDESWGGLPFDKRRHVGAWYSPSYDPELKRLIFGTSVTSPAPKYLLSGNEYTYLYHNSTMSLDAETGKIIWHYQHLVDHWDLDHPFERLLIDTAVAPDPASVPWINPKVKAGERRKVITGIPGKTGIIYTLDRVTGEFLWARPTVYQNVVSRIDGTTGKVVANTDTIFSKQGDSRVVCPAIAGGKNWQAGTYDPTSGLMFFPLQNSCMAVTAVIDKPSTESLYGVASKNIPVPETAGAVAREGVGNIYAIDVASGKTVWHFNQEAGTMSLLSTDGGLLFGGDAAGKFRAYESKTGKVLWETALDRAVTGFPVTFAVNGKQYVAVSTGPWLHAGLNPGIKVGDENALYVFAIQ